MIIKGSRISSDSDPKHIINHLMNMGENEKVRVLQGGEFTILSAFHDARHTEKTYAIRHMIFAGKEAMSEADGWELLNDCAQEFGFEAEDATLVEHTKPRENGAGSEVHYHIAVSEVLRSGRVLSSQMMRVRHEKLARSFEAKHGLEIIKGRHNRAVVHARPDLAQVMQKACEGDLPKESYTSESHQGLKRKGKNMPSIKSEIVSLWNGNIDDFRSGLLKNGYSFEQGDKNPSAYVIRDIDGSLVGSVSRILKIKQKDFARLYKQWENENVRTIQQNATATAEKEGLQSTHEPIPARDSGQGTSDRGTHDNATSDRETGGKTGSRDHIIGADRQRGNGRNPGYSDKAEGRPARPARRDQSVIGNDSEPAKPDDTAYKRLAVVRLSTLKVLPKPAFIITKEDARRTWELASKLRKTPEEYQHLRRSYDNMNNLGFGLIFKTPEAGIKYASKVLASLIVEVVSSLAQGFKLAFFGGSIEPAKVGQITRDVRRNVLPDVYDIYAKAYSRLAQEARDAGRKPASPQDMTDLMLSVDPMAKHVRRRFIVRQFKKVEQSGLYEPLTAIVIRNALSGHPGELLSLTNLDRDRFDHLFHQNMSDVFARVESALQQYVLPEPAPVPVKEPEPPKSEELYIEKCPEPVLLPEVTPLSETEQDKKQVITERPKSPTPARKDPSPF